MYVTCTKQSNNNKNYDRQSFHLQNISLNFSYVSAMDATRGNTQNMFILFYNWFYYRSINRPHCSLETFLIIFWLCLNITRLLINAFLNLHLVGTSFNHKYKTNINFSFEISVITKICQWHLLWDHCSLTLIHLDEISWNIRTKLSLSDDVRTLFDLSFHILNVSLDIVLSCWVYSSIIVCYAWR